MAETESGPDLRQPIGRLADFPPRRWHLAVAFGAAALLYLVCVNNRYYPSPDSAYYLGLGRSIATGEGYRFSGELSDHVTPGLPLVLAGLHRLFGPAFWPANLLMALTALGAVWLIYVTIGRMSDRRTALAVAAGMGLSYLMFNNAQFIQTDVPMIALLFAIVYCCVRYQAGGVAWLVLAGLLVVAAITVRAPGGLVLGPVALGLALERRSAGNARRRWAAAGCVMGCLIASAGFFFVLARLTVGTPRYVRSVAKHVGHSDITVLDRPLGGLLRFLEILGKMVTGQNSLAGLGAVLAVLLVVGLAILWRRGHRLAVTAAVAYPLGLFAVWRAASMPDRYLLPVEPFMLWAMLEGLWWAVERTGRLVKRPVSAHGLLVAATALVTVMLACNLPRVGRVVLTQTYHARTPRYYRVAHGGDFRDVENVAAVLARELPADAPAAMPYNVRVMHVLSGRPIRQVPLKRKDKTEDARLSVDYFLAHPQVRLLALNIDQMGGPAAKAAADLLADQPVELIYQSKDYRVYRKTGALTPASQPGP